MNRKKIQRLMNKYGLKCPVRKANPYRRMAKAIKTDAVAGNLVNREFREHGPMKTLLTTIDINGILFKLSPNQYAEYLRSDIYYMALFLKCP